MNVNVIDNIRQYFSTQPVRKAWLFGSFSRGEETAQSDVDILVEFDRSGKPVTLLTYARMWRELEERLGLLCLSVWTCCLDIQGNYMRPLPILYFFSLVLPYTRSTLGVWALDSTSDFVLHTFSPPDSSSSIQRRYRKPLKPLSRSTWDNC